MLSTPDATGSNATGQRIGRGGIGLEANSPVTDVKRHVSDWVQLTATPGIDRRKHGEEPQAATLTSGRALLDQARESLRAMEDEEQQVLKSHTQDQQSLSQSFQILLFAPKLENAISQMQEGEWGYLLNGDRASVDVYKQALMDFYAYHGHLTVLASQANAPKQLQLLQHIAAIRTDGSGKRRRRNSRQRRRTGTRRRRYTADHGKELLDNARKQIRIFENAEYERYAGRRSGARNSTGC